MFAFLSATVARTTAGDAVRAAASWAATKITSKSWSRILKKTLQHFCTSFEWDESASAVDSCTIKNIVPRTSVVNQLLAKFGLRLAAEGCKLETCAIKITLKMRSDLGIFSEPWRVEVSGLRLNLELGAAPCEEKADFDGWEEDMSFVSAESSPQAEFHQGDGQESKGASDWLPLHKAMENMRLSLSNVSVNVNSSGPDTAIDAATVARVRLMMRLRELAIFTTDEHWKELPSTAEIAGGSTVHKVARLNHLQVTSHTQHVHVFPDEAAEAGTMPDLSKADISLETPTPFPPSAMTADQPRVLIEGVCGEVKVTKQVKSLLSGSVARDFIGERYRIDCSLQSDGRPRLSMPSLPIVIEWDEVREVFKMLFDGQIKTSFSHVIEAPELVECMWWQQQLKDAFNAVQPGLAAQLANEKRWRTEEHTRACQLQSELQNAKVAWKAQDEATRKTLQQQKDEQERARAQAAGLARSLESLVRELDGGSRLDPARLVELTQQARLLANPDASTTAAGSSSSNPRLARVGTDDYQFGDLTAGTAKAVASAAQNYQFGDGMRSLGLFGGKRK